MAFVSPRANLQLTRAIYLDKAWPGLRVIVLLEIIQEKEMTQILILVGK